MAIWFWSWVSELADRLSDWAYVQEKRAVRRARGHA